MHVVALVNGPGELAGWFLPTAARLKAMAPGISVTAVITPCQYASGRETEVVEGAGDVDRVVRFWVFAREVWAQRSARQADDGTLVLQFGGDPWYGRLAAWLMGAPLWKHGTSAAGAQWTERFLVPDDRIRQKLLRHGVPEQRITPVGQIVVDSARVVRTAGWTSGQLLFLPGSRYFEIEKMVPFFVAVADEVLAARPSTPVAISRSSFVDRRAFIRLLQAAGCDVADGADGLTCRSPGGRALMILENDWRWSAGPGDLAVLLPGTTTLQLAALGTPMVVLLPLNWGERVPFDGLVGLLLPTRMPFGLIRRYLTRIMNRFVGPVALPNIIAGVPLVTELRGVLSPASVARDLRSLLDDDDHRRRLSARLIEMAGPPGAADRMAAAILSRIEGCGSRPS